MVPIDGTYTMSLDGISEITRRLRASVVLPMHRFATPLEEFMQRIGKEFEIDVRKRAHLADFARDPAIDADCNHSGWHIANSNFLQAHPAGFVMVSAKQEI